MQEIRDELTLYVTKIGVDYNTKKFIRIMPSYPGENFWFELPKDGIPEKIDLPRGKLMEKFWEDLQPCLQKWILKREELSNRFTGSYRAKYSKEFISMGSVRLSPEKEIKKWSDFHMPMSDDEIYFVHSVLTMSGSFF